MLVNPEKIEVKRLNKQNLLDFQQLILLFQTVFEAKKHLIDASYLTQLLDKQFFIVYAIFVDNELAGGLTAYELPMYRAEYAEIFIYDIAIKPAFQRKGLGRKLLSEIENYCKQNKIPEMFVAADEADQHALDFYHATGGNASKVIHYNYSFED
jgi:aminoglycoside 3-N-acetyltransferase I